MNQSKIRFPSKSSKFKVSENDTMSWYLDDKLVKGYWLAKEILNPWSNEKVEIKMWPHYLSIASSGLYSGWVLSAWEAIGTFSYTSWEALYVDNSTFPAIVPSGADFIAQTDVPLTDILTQPVTYICVDINWLPVQFPSFPTPEQRRDNRFLWVVVHSDNVNVNRVNNQPDIALDVVAQLHDLMEGLRSFNLQWNRITANGANLSIDKSVWSIFKSGINFINNVKDPHTALLVKQTLATFRYRNQDSSEGSDVTVLDPTTYDNWGTTTTVPVSNNATIQRIYIFPTGGIRIQRGQEVFSNLSKAIDSVGKEAFITESNIDENGLLLASVVMKKRATDLTDNWEALIFIASRFWELGSVGSSATTSLQQAYINATDPEIETTNWAVSLKNGWALDTENVLEIRNLAGIDTFEVTGDGDVKASGKVGIGKTPNYEVDVVGEIAATGSIYPKSGQANGGNISAFNGGVSIQGISGFVAIWDDLGNGTVQTSIGHGAWIFGRNATPSISQFTNTADTPTKVLTIHAQGARPSAVTNLIGGSLQLTGGAGASASSGLATGWSVNIDGGVGYGTGSDGDILLQANQNGMVGVGETAPDTKLHNGGAYTQNPLSSDPADPWNGNSVQWVSDGTWSGDAWDVMMKINIGGTTKITTLVDYSTL